MKTCNKCGNLLPLEDFTNSKNNKGGKSTWCKSCHNKDNREWNKANRDKQKNSILKHTYGITLEQYNELLELQEGKCAICGTAECKMNRKLAVDHSHKTGKVRGLLCGVCNTALGKFNDDIELLKRAIVYLQLK